MRAETGLEAMGQAAGCGGTEQLDGLKGYR